MSPFVVTVVFATVVAISMLGGLFGSGRAPTIHAFFWGNQGLNSQFGASLLLSSSFSLNGLLYQSWLGYTTGWWSLLIQLVWCLGYILLAVHTPRFGGMLQSGTLHGIIGTFFGPAAQHLASIASLLGFTIMIGWEASVGTAILRGAHTGGAELSIAIPIVVCVMCGLYTCAGGLRGNALVNFALNIFKAVALIFALVALLSISPLGVRSLIHSNAAMITGQTAWTSLGGIALTSNLAFSAFWQVCDMSNWQDLSSVRNTHNRRFRVIVASAILVFIFPGLIGTLFGITLSSIHPIGGPITDSNIVSEIIEQVSAYPILSLAIIAACAAAMLSTVDGLALSGAQSLTWDLTNRIEVQRLLPLGPDRVAGRGDEVVIAAGRLGIVALCIVGACATFFLTETLGIPLFSIVYIAVVAQMSLIGPVLYALFVSDDGRIKKNGWPIILASLLIGFLFCLVGAVSKFDWALTFAPVITIFVSLVGTAIVPSQRRKLAQPST